MFDFCNIKNNWKGGKNVEFGFKMN
ncbi:uncharacterized protein METZ01_LOCUS50618 [marine metagenome]|uniref:Uncharacterized protein n=1 Tax=marine metagenome TaxID=408172 RepID=A0A381S2U2_9ZZZZ